MEPKTCPEIVTLYARQPQCIEVGDVTVYLTRSVAALVHELACAGRPGLTAAHIGAALETSDVYGLVHRARLVLRTAAPCTAWIHAPVTGCYILARPWPDIRWEE